MSAALAIVRKDNEIAGLVGRIELIGHEQVAHNKAQCGCLEIAHARI